MVKLEDASERAVVLGNMIDELISEIPKHAKKKLYLDHIKTVREYNENLNIEFSHREQSFLNKISRKKDPSFEVFEEKTLFSVVLLRVLDSNMATYFQELTNADIAYLTICGKIENISTTIDMISRKLRRPSLKGIDTGLKDTISSLYDEEKVQSDF